MKRSILALLLILAAVSYSCTVNEEPLKGLNDGSVVFNPEVSVEPFVFDGPATKTVLSIDDQTGAKFTFAETDVLGVFPYSPEQGGQVQFAVKSVSETSCKFDGNGFSLEAGQLYAAYYPYMLAANGDWSPSNPDGTSSADMMTQIPVSYLGQTQAAADGSFNISAADFMAANAISPADGACKFKMSHLGALVVMDVTFGEAGTYTELSLTSDGAPFVTAGTVDLTQEITLGDTPAQNIAFEAEETAASVTLALGAGDPAGIAIEAGETVRFCMMVAPVDLRNAEVTLSVKDTDGATHSAVVASKNFKAGYAYKLACDLDAPEPANPTNLSASGTANTYIVDVDNINLGGYYFNAAVAGNGETNTNAYFNTLGLSAAIVYPTDGATLTGAGVKSIWIENNCITDLAYDATNSTITFKATGAKGCAKVTLTSAANGDRKSVV